VAASIQVSHVMTWPGDPVTAMLEAAEANICAAVASDAAASRAMLARVRAAAGPPDQPGPHDQPGRRGTSGAGDEAGG
jgi:hypothetical protein